MKIYCTLQKLNKKYDLLNPFIHRILQGSKQMLNRLYDLLNPLKGLLGIVFHFSQVRRELAILFSETFGEISWGIKPYFVGNFCHRLRGAAKQNVSLLQTHLPK